MCSGSSLESTERAQGAGLRAADIKAYARTLGFDVCGIAPAADHPELSFFRKWLDRGYGGRMTYLHRSARKRVDR